MTCTITTTCDNAHFEFIKFGHAEGCIDVTIYNCIDESNVIDFIDDVTKAMECTTRVKTVLGNARALPY